MQICEQAQNVRRGGAVEVAGRLVGEQHDGLIGKRTGDRDPLALTTRKRRRQVVGAIAQTDALQELVRSATGTAPRRPGQKRWQLASSDRRQFAHELERLEHEPDLMATNARQPTLVHPVKLLAGDADTARGRPFQTTQQIKQSRLSAAARPNDRGRLPGGDVDAHIIDPVTTTSRPYSLRSPRADTTDSVSAILGPLPRSNTSALLQPTQVGLQTQHYSLQQQRRH